MEIYTETIDKSKTLYIGIDVHKTTWHVTIIQEEEIRFSGSLTAQWRTLQQLLERYRSPGISCQAVYEAGYFGYWLHDRLEEYGVCCIVTPPSLIPIEYGNHVKTDRRDSQKLARLLSKGLLKRVVVPTEQERHHRHVVRRRRQLANDRVRVQNRIKADLRFYGIEFPDCRGRWSTIYLENLSRLHWNDRWIEESFHRLLEQYEFLTEQIKKQTQLISELAETEQYRDRVTLLVSIPGIGVLTAMELLVELQDVARFRTAKQLAAYVGLTPSQYSSGDHVRMGRITATGKNRLRGLLIESAWHLIAKDPAMREKYDAIKLRAGAKRAIVAIARHLLIRARRLILNRQSYVFGLVA